MVTAAVIVPATLVVFPENDLTDTVKWALTGGILSAAMDLDVLLVVLIRSGKEPRLRRYRNIFNIFREFRSFKDTIASTGVMRTGLVTHFFIATLLVTMSALLMRQYLFPVVLAVLSHIITDLPNFRILADKRASSSD